MNALDRRAWIAGSVALLAMPRARAQNSPAPSADTVRKLRTRFAVNGEIWWGGVPFVERIAKAAEHGFRSFEFWPWRGKDIAAIAKLTKELGMTVAQFTAWGFSPGLNQQKNHAKFVEEIEAACKVAHELDRKSVV